ncbi:MAG: hypothetical protein ABI445_11670 [Polyangia bacterium]
MSNVIEAPPPLGDLAAALVEAGWVVCKTCLSCVTREGAAHHVKRCSKAMAASA